MTRFLLLLCGVALSAGCSSDARDDRRAHVGHVAHARAGVHCTRCHAGMETGPAPHLPDDATCAACHEQAHPQQADRACTGCHVDADARAVQTEAAAGMRFDHGAHRVHTGSDCVQCHRGAIHADLERPGALPAHADCRECHAAWIDEDACDRCHTSLARYPVRPLLDMSHGADFLRRHALEARAREATCGQCHVRGFCADCHDERAPMAPDVAHADRPDRAFVHRPGYVSLHAGEARLDTVPCLSCHHESSCVACHDRTGRGPGDASPHPTGWSSAGPGPNDHAAAARRDLLSCAGCHSGAGGDTCVTCHATGRPGGSPHGSSRPSGDPRHDRPCIRCHGGAP